MRRRVRAAKTDATAEAAVGAKRARRKVAAAPAEAGEAAEEQAASALGGGMFAPGAIVARHAWRAPWALSQCGHIACPVNAL